jgi:hypothetical protein
MKKTHYLYLLFAIILTVSLFNKIFNEDKTYKIFSFSVDIYSYYLWKVGLILYLLFHFFKRERNLKSIN